MSNSKFIYEVGNYSFLLMQESEHSPELACTALLILLVLILTLNIFVVLSILVSPLRSSSYNAFIACIATVSVLEGVLNVTSSVVLHSSWVEIQHQYGMATAEKVCRGNAVFLQITGMIWSLVFAALVHDRRSRLSASERTTLKKKRVAYTILIFALASVALACPLGVGLLRVALFHQRMSCSPTGVSPESINVFVPVIVAATFGASWLFTICSGVVVVKRVLNIRRRLLDIEFLAQRRAIERRRSPRGITSGNEFGNDFGGLAEAEGDSLPHLLTDMLTMSFLVMVVPNIVVTQTKQFHRDHSKLTDVSDSDLREIRTNMLDSFFAWTRYCFSVLSPGLMFLIHKNVREIFVRTFCCYLSAENRLTLSLPSGMKLKRSKKLADFRTPVLFTTSQGLHLRTVKDDSSVEPVFVIRFCDLTLKEPSKASNESGEISLPAAKSIDSQSEEKSNLSETFIIKERQWNRLGDTYVKIPNGFDKSIIDSRDRSNSANRIQQ